MIIMTDNSYTQPPRIELDAYFDTEMGELILDGVPEGPAGGVDITPTEGLLIGFDAATGMVSTIMVEPLFHAGQLSYQDEQRRLLGSLFPGEVLEELIDLHKGDHHLRVAPNRAMLDQLYRLALLETAQAFDPVAPESPLWDLEALALAHEAHLVEMGHLVARQSLLVATDLFMAYPWLLGDAKIRSWVPLLSSYGAPVDAEAADELRNLSEQTLLAELEEEFKNQLVHRQLEPSVLGEPNQPDTRLITEGALDLTLVANATFVTGTYPTDDLSVSVSESGVLIAAVRLHPYARRSTVESHVLRLVDRQAKEVIASSVLEYHGSTARAAFEPPSHPEISLEIAQGSNEPVSGSGLYHLRLGYRYGLGALRARRGPATLYPDLRPSHLEREVKNLWLSARTHLSEAGENGRGTLAELYAGSSRELQQESQWVADRSDVPLRSEAPFLGEDVVLPGSSADL
jgi:hypothetical protein